MMTILNPVPLLEQGLGPKREREILHVLSGKNPSLSYAKETYPNESDALLPRCGELKNTRLNSVSTFPTCTLGGLRFMMTMWSYEIRLSTIQ